MRRPRVNIIGILLVYSLFLGCSTARLRIESKPSGARVFADEKLLGQTPLELTKKEYNDLMSGHYLALRVTADGHEAQRLILDPASAQEIRVDLKSYDRTYFTESLIPDFQMEMNELTRRLLLIQGSIVAKKFELASQQITEFQNQYPNVAASWVLQAHVELAQGRREEAIRYLTRAQTIDPQDPVSRRMLESLKQRTAP